MSAENFILAGTAGSHCLGSNFGCQPDWTDPAPQAGAPAGAGPSWMATGLPGLTTSWCERVGLDLKTTSWACTACTPHPGVLGGSSWRCVLCSAPVWGSLSPPWEPRPLPVTRTQCQLPRRSEGREAVVSASPELGCSGFLSPTRGREQRWACSQG